MAVRLSIILFLLLPVIAQAQLKSDFVGICTFDDFVNTTGDNYRGDILNFIDRYNLGVSTKNIQIGDEIVDGSGDVFEVLTIHSTASNFEADVTVQARVSASGAPTGSGQVYRPTSNGIVPPASVDNLGLSNVTKGLIDMHNALRLDSLLGTVANGDSIIAVSFGNDSLSITMESDTVYTAIIPVDSLHQLQADSIAALYDSLGVKVDTIIAGNNINITYANGQYTISAPDPNVGTDDQTAGEVWYNDTYLPLNVNDVQQAIDSLKRDLDAVSAGASDGVATAGTLDVGNEEIDVTVAAPGSAFSIDISGIETLSSFSGWDMNAADDFSGAWGDLTGVPAGFADNVDDVDDADADATNEGSLTVAAGTGSTAVINSNTSGSTGVTIEAQAGIGITENTGTGTIFIENTGDLDATNEIDIIGFTGDAGSAQQIGDGEFLDLEGGFGVVTTMSTDKANFKIDTSQVATVFALADSLSNISAGTGWLKDSLEAGDVRISQAGVFEIENPTATDSIYFHNPDGGALNIISDKAELTGATIELNTNNLVLDGPRFNSGSGADEYFLVVNSVGMVDTVHNVSGGTATNIYNTSDTITTDRKVIAQDQNTYLDFLGFDYLNVDNDDGSNNIGLRINGAATAGFENRLLVLSDGKGQDSILFRHEYRGGLGGFGIVSTIDTDFSSPGFTLTSGSNRLNLATNEYTDGTNSKGLEYAADYSANFTDESLVTKRYVDAQVVGGSAYWKDTLSVTQTVVNSSGLDFVFGSTQLDDSGNAAEDERIVFDNSKGFFAAGRFQGTQVDNANRGVVAANFGLNNTASGDASVAAGGQNNAATGTGTYVHGENALAPLRNQYAHGAGAGSANSGAAQYMRLMGYRDFTGTGTVKIYMDGSSEHFVIPNNTVWNGTAYCNVVVTTAGGTVGVGDRVFLRAQFSAKNEAGIVDVLPNYDNPGLNDASMGAVGLLLGADNTNDALNVNISSVPGSVSSAVRCACYFDIMQTKF